MRSIRLVTFSSALFLALVGGAATAQAHAYLDHASPLVGSVVSAPSEVRLWFTQALEPRFSAAQLRSGSGAVVGTGAVDPANPKEMVIRVRALPPGKYKVKWKILSTDSHRTEGDFGFEVKP